MSTQRTRKPNTHAKAPRSPAEWGQHLARSGSLKGLPYGPGARQEAALEAFRKANREVGE